MSFTFASSKSRNKRDAAVEQIDAVHCLSRSALAELLQTLTDETLPNWPLHLQRQFVAYRLQERNQGRLTPKARRQLQSAMAQKQRLENTPVRSGTRIIRDWNGTIISVLSLPNGKFEWEGREYRSLSQIACEVTGTHWSGPRFFGLVKKAA